VSRSIWESPVVSLHLTLACFDLTNFPPELSLNR